MHVLYPHLFPPLLLIVYQDHLPLVVVPPQNLLLNAQKRLPERLRVLRRLQQLPPRLLAYLRVRHVVASLLLLLVRHCLELPDAALDRLDIEVEVDDFGGLDDLLLFEGGRQAETAFPFEEFLHGFLFGLEGFVEVYLDLIVEISFDFGFAVHGLDPDVGFVF